jgi:hypothetical protein
MIRDELVEDVEHLLGYDRPLRIVERVGSTPSAVARALHRAGRPDLARPFDRLYYEQRLAAGWKRPPRRSRAKAAA